MNANVQKKFEIPVHRNVICPNCNVGIGYGYNIIGKDDIQCPKCNLIFSYEDGLIANILNIAEHSLADIFLHLPVCAGVIEISTIDVTIGVSKNVMFITDYDEIYTLQIGVGKEIHLSSTVVKDDFIISFTNITKKGFTIVSSLIKNEVIDKNVNVTYLVTGRDKNIKDIPIWIKLLQNVINLINKEKYSMAIVQSISTFDAYFDEFLGEQLEKIRGYEKDIIINILRNENRRDKLFYYLYYVTNISFEDSPYNNELKSYVELRNKIVHPKQYEFDESSINKENALNTLRTIVNSIGWINNIKFK